MAHQALLAMALLATISLAGCQGKPIYSEDNFTVFVVPADENQEPVGYVWSSDTPFADGSPEEWSVPPGETVAYSCPGGKHENFKFRTFNLDTKETFYVYEWEEMRCGSVRFTVSEDGQVEFSRNHHNKSWW